MTADSRQAAQKPPRYRHPVTVLALCLFAASYLFMSVWYLAPQWGRIAIWLASPLKMFTGDAASVVIGFLGMLAIDAAIGAALFLSLRHLGDRFFGFRPQSAFRFGLRTLFGFLTAAAILFTVANTWMLQTAVTIVFEAAVGLSLLNVVVYIVYAERDRARALARRRLAPRAEDEEPLEAEAPEAMEWADTGRPGG
jgi:hypothetical protein